METLFVYPDSLLKKCQSLFEKVDIRTKWSGPTNDAPYNSLLALLTDVGERKSSLAFEFCFLPRLEEAADQGIFVLQTFMTIMEDAPASTYQELFKTISKINTQLPVGAFGLFEDTGVLYFKYNCIINKQAGDETLVDTIDKQTGLIIHQLYLFTDALLDVAEGIKSSVEALKNAPLI